MAKEKSNTTKLKDAAETVAMRVKDSSTNERLAAGAVALGVAAGAVTATLAALKGKSKKSAKRKPATAPKPKAAAKPKAVPKPKASVTPRASPKPKTTAARVNTKAS